MNVGQAELAFVGRGVRCCHRLDSLVPGAFMCAPQDSKCATSRMFDPNMRWAVTTALVA